MSLLIYIHVIISYSEMRKDADVFALKIEK